MALIQQLTSLRTEDFPSQKDWIPRLLLPLNQFLLGATAAINGNITFGDNIPCQTQTLSFVFGSQSSQTQFKWTLKAKPVELRVCSATEDGTPIAINIAWSYVNGQVYVTEIWKLSASGVSALTSGSVYNIVLRGNP